MLVFIIVNANLIFHTLPLAPCPETRLLYPIKIRMNDKKVSRHSSVISVNNHFPFYFSVSFAAKK